MKRVIGTAMLAALFALASSAQYLSQQDLTQEAQDAAAAAKVKAEAAMQNMKVMQEELTQVITNSVVIRAGNPVTSNVKNAPYQGQQVTETTQTLGDGTRIHEENTVTLYRDGQGRTRREQPGEISITDPVAGVGYVLNTQEMTARKSKAFIFADTGASGGVYSVQVNKGVAFSGAGENKPALFTSANVLSDSNEVHTVTVNGKSVTRTPKKEDLGTQMMEGVKAQGERRTTTIDAGEIGNDRPIQIVNEHWFSADLHMDVMSKHSDPRIGETTTRLINIIRAEPSPSMFEVPSGYTIIEPGVKAVGRGGRGGGNDNQ